MAKQKKHTRVSVLGKAFQAGKRAAQSGPAQFVGGSLSGVPVAVVSGFAEQRGLARDFATTLAGARIGSNILMHGLFSRKPKGKKENSLQRLERITFTPANAGIAFGTTSGFYWGRLASTGSAFK